MVVTTDFVERVERAYTVNEFNFKRRWMVIYSPCTATRLWWRQCSLCFLRYTVNRLQRIHSFETKVTNQQSSMVSAIKISKIGQAKLVLLDRMTTRWNFAIAIRKSDPSKFWSYVNSCKKTTGCLSMMYRANKKAQIFFRFSSKVFI